MDLISKYELIEKIVQTENETLLHQIKLLIEDGEIESWNSLNTYLKASINKGLEQSNKGEVIAHTNVLKRIKKKYAIKS